MVAGRRRRRGRSLILPEQVVALRGAGMAPAFIRPFLVLLARSARGDVAQSRDAVYGIFAVAPHARGCCNVAG